MAIGGRKALAVDVCVAVSGGTAEKPVGSVWIAWSGLETNMGKPLESRLYHFDGDRKDIQRAAITMTLNGIIKPA